MLVFPQSDLHTCRCLELPSNPVLSEGAQDFAEQATGELANRRSRRQ